MTEFLLTYLGRDVGVDRGGWDRYGKRGWDGNKSGCDCDVGNGEGRGWVKGVVCIFFLLLLLLFFPSCIVVPCERVGCVYIYQPIKGHPFRLNAHI